MHETHRKKLIVLPVLKKNNFWQAISPKSQVTAQAGFVSSECKRSATSNNALNSIIIGLKYHQNLFWSKIASKSFLGPTYADNQLWFVLTNSKFIAIQQFALMFAPCLLQIFWDRLCRFWGLGWMHRLFTSAPVITLNSWQKLEFVLI